MKYTIIFNLTLLLFIVRNVNCAVSYKPNAIHEDYPGKCVLLDNNPPIVIDRGQTVQLPNQCMTASCSHDFTAHFETCGLIHVVGCDLTEIDYKLPYPDCCQKPKC